MINELLALYLRENLLSPANIFMILLGVFWLIIASILDFKKREVENWWTFSLIAILLAFRAFLSVENADYRYFMWGLIGGIIGFLLCNLFYYARMFGGGDAKFLIALGVILPFSFEWRINLAIFIIFILILLFSGAVYGGIYCIFLTVINFKKFKAEFAKEFRKSRKTSYGVCVLCAILFAFFYFMGFYAGAALAGILFLTPALLIYARAVENSCMQKYADVKTLTIGDLLVEPLKIKGKTIKYNWEGLSEKELLFIQKNYKKKVLIKYGIPFMPAFLISLVTLSCAIYCLV